MPTKTPETCYLCGKVLSDPISKDHCPPKALFAKELRRQYKPDQLTTLPVHQGCNESYSLDEQYFVATLLPLAPGSESGDSIFRESIAKAHRDESRMRLARMVLGEFEQRPSGLYLPPDLIAKRQQGDRIHRVAWKIVRGLYFHHCGKTLPEAVGVSSELAPAGVPASRLFQYLIHIKLDKGEIHGRYPGVFSYLYHRFEVEGHGELNLWALGIWERVLMGLTFHEPWSCQCETCISAIQSWGSNC